jgi:mannose-6-phosphate isomerase-like protein (cupin superfamily)
MGKRRARSDRTAGGSSRVAEAGNTVRRNRPGLVEVVLATGAAGGQSMAGLAVREGDVAPRRYMWGEARRFVSVTGPSWEQYLSEGTLATSGLSLGRGTVASRCEKPPGVHEDEEEAYLVLKGTGICTVGDEKVHVSAGSVVYIPAGVRHGLMNSGTEPLEYVFALGFRRPA